MGVAFYPVFENDNNGWPDDMNGKCLARAADLLDKACRRASVPALYDFYSMSRDQMISELLEGDPEDPSSYDESQLQEESWYDPAAALKTVHVLLDYVRSNSGQFSDYQSVLEDLEAFERHLSIAAEKNMRWHLMIDA